MAAGLASSASGFAALTMALNDLCGWNLSAEKLSIIARLGSGSACRSIYDGFVEWQCGKRPDGMDSYAIPFKEEWEGLEIGVILISKEEKAISSREAMEMTVKKSIFYHNWVEKAEKDVKEIKEAIISKDFEYLAEIVESNCLGMHATMFGLHPPIIFWKPGTMKMIEQVYELHRSGVEVCFTIDAGPNVKVIFTRKDSNEVKGKLPLNFSISLFPE